MRKLIHNISAILTNKSPIKSIFILLAAFFAVSVGTPDVEANNAARIGGKLGTIKGVVRDQAGKPIDKATVAVFRAGTSKLLKQVLSSTDGSFIARIVPGTYSILAVAEGFNPVSYGDVAVNRSSELVYKFNLEASGKGNTLPEKKAERNSSKYPIRAAQIRRSIYQIGEGETPIDTEKVETETVAEVNDGERSSRKGQSIVETYVASDGDSNYSGLNFATSIPVNENADVIVAGQTGSGDVGANRIETSVRVRASRDHQLRFKGSLVSLGKVNSEHSGQRLGQVSFQALDEWNVREGIILVYGFDYSRFVGAEGSSINPRLGFQFDINSKTRFRAAYTTATEERSWQRALELEDSQILFREPISMPDVLIENETPQIHKNRRLEFGIERVIDNKSTIEANLFFDAVSGRGVGLVNLPVNSLNSSAFDEFVGNQHGKASGIRIVYARRLNGMFSTSAGYSFGNGQKLSEDGISTPENLFENAFFQTFVGQFESDFESGTNIKTVFRLSPHATIFAIDPFAGRMAIYDPSLSVLVTQSLPTWGLPFRAEAILDARNLLDFQSSVNGEEGTLRLSSQKLTLRGGISLRF